MLLLNDGSARGSKSTRRCRCRSFTSTRRRAIRHIFEHSLQSHRRDGGKKSDAITTSNVRSERHVERIGRHSQVNALRNRDPLEFRSSTTTHNAAFEIVQPTSHAPAADIQDQEIRYCGKETFDRAKPPSHRLTLASSRYASSNSCRGRESSMISEFSSRYSES